ncbi:MAG: cytochrome c oxidase assembly protein [Proteobacteria bacterium]|nr:cytochrome c oxidase assembly protein [Pseudomonadota bacterium]
MSDPNRKRMIRTAAIAIGAVAGMTAMSFAAVPLYRAFCQATGYGGTTQVARAAPTRVLAQTVQVRFDTNVATDLPITFTPKQASETLHIGETGLAFFHVRNDSSVSVTARATYNVAPHSAGQYFNKLECFCFQDRVLAPGEEADLPVVFFVDPAFARDPETRGLDTLTLSYTYFRSVAPPVQTG